MEYAYLLGFICHFALDSRCHGYINEMVKETGVSHLEIEEEFEKYLLPDGGEESSQLSHRGFGAAGYGNGGSGGDFYENITPVAAKQALFDLRAVKKFFDCTGKIETRCGEYGSETDFSLQTAERADESEKG